VLIEGPYFVRGAKLNGRKELQLTGDLSGDTLVKIYVPESVLKVTWNGVSLETTQLKPGILTSQLRSSAVFSLPPLIGWTFTDSLPEIKADYTADSEGWIS
jgi:hypothetical protein